ncbi:MAG: glycogen synthase [Chloroflexi bacterium]|nr:glycogen synthase [Chloroflexota bacterium]
MTEDRPLRVLMMAAEIVPYVKTGQVADVISGLARALRRLGHDVRVAIPRYSHIDIERFGLSPVLPAFPVPMNRHHDSVTVYYAEEPAGIPVYMMDNPRYFGQRMAALHGQDPDPFIFYPRATLEMIRQPGFGWVPDVIHCHDWQTALVPNWLSTLYRDDPLLKDTATVLTIHRLSHQGIFGYRVLEVAGIREFGFLYHSGIADLGELVDLMGRGIYYADAITTVSQSYAKEILTPEYGERLDPLLRDRRDALFGILNGIDTELYNPATDPHIPARFDADSLDKRAANKPALRQAFGLNVAEVPLIGMVSRLVDAKGLDLLTAMVEPIMAHLDLQLAVVGVGEPKYHSMLQEFANRYAGRIGVRLTFDDKLERLVYAGSDMFLMPSRLEPCGLGQMLAMRYGSVPIVRATGGLADTVDNYDPSSGEGTGFSFVAYEPIAMYTAIVRAVEVYHMHERWRALQRQCMQRDFSWDASARRYITVYHFARQAHREHPRYETGWVG